MAGKATIIISDFHLGGGHGKGHFDHFDQDSEFCNFLEYYGGLLLYDELRLIVNGDFLDSIQVMLNGTLLTRVYEDDALLKVRLIVSQHPEVFSRLKCFASSMGRSITFIIGNHDPALAFLKVQKYLKELIGDNIEFISGTYNDQLITVVHGNNWDTANRFENEEILMIDTRGTYVKFPWGSLFVIDFVSKVRKRVPDIDKIKPLGAFIRWALLNRPFDALITITLFVRFFIKYRFSDNTYQRFTLGKLIYILKGSCYSCDFVDKAVSYFEKIKEGILVVGHTHRAVKQSFSEKQIYLNTGTWNPILVFREGKFLEFHHRTFALIVNNSSEGLAFPNEVKLLEWIPNSEPEEYHPTFFNTHMHPQMNGLLKLKFIGRIKSWLGGQKK